MEEEIESQKLQKKERKVWLIMYLVLLLFWGFVLMEKVGFERYLTHFPIPLTMIFGGFVSGFAPVGGGAVSFPVFSKVLEMAPAEARDFGFAIQSFGMTFASVSILIRKIKIEKNVVLFSCIGGGIGIVLANLFIVPIVAAPVMKILFTIMTASFGIALFLNNFVTQKKEKYWDSIGEVTTQDKLILILVGIIGGGLSGVLGTGIDIFTFSIVTILYRLDEKVLNPSSDLIMAFTSMMGLAGRFIFAGGLEGEVMLNFPLAVPIVTIVAPLGAIAVSKLSRKAIVKVIIIGILIEVITTLWAVELTPNVVTTSLITLTLSYLFYYRLTKLAGEKMHKKQSSI